ncbi:hypothetical protein LPJ63_001981 [Coemansia sp. RSA 2711]|nr:hypothetical protein LPJ63_001981 [Coemansia sp. RSA 2711]KAJ2369102.1 hypothetical protein H4S01_001208 [Coemansia sp. RSA 2610]KAJ2392384.1 hypothetical protein H4S02_000824 [Coemansia sp. RSA 2611]
MSQILNEPWLCPLFAGDVQLDTDNTKDGRRVQMFGFSRTDERYPVTCEISDKHHYMRAALTKKSVQAFERAREREINTMNGLLIQIQTFRIMLYRGNGRELKKRRNKRGKEPQPHPCPQRIRGDGEPQLWMLITKFAYLGGEGNSVFDSPVHIRFDPQVNHKMGELMQRSAKQAGAENTNKSTGRARKQRKSTREKAQADNAGSGPADPENADRHAQKRPRVELDTSSSLPPLQLSPFITPLNLSGSAGAHSTGESAVRWPTIDQVPFVSDVEMAWTCSGLWQSLCIQSACIPSMPVHALRVAPASAPTPSARPAKSASRTNDGNDHTPDRASNAHQLPGLARAEPRITPAVTLDSLGGLLISSDSGLLSAGAIMEQMYGTMSSPALDAHDTTPHDGIDANMLLSQGLV